MRQCLAGRMVNALPRGLWFTMLCLSGISALSHAQESASDSLAIVAPALAKLVPKLPTPSFVADVPHLLTDADHARIDERIREHQLAGLGDIGVAVIPSVGAYAPNAVALAIYRTWRIGTRARVGSARRDLGVLLLIVPRELAPDHRGQCFISTGPGVQGDITDATAGRICRDVMIPELRNRAYAAAIMAGIEAIAERLRRDQALVSGAAADSQVVSPAPESGSVQSASDASRKLAPSSRISERRDFAVGVGIFGSAVALVGAGVFWRWRRRYRVRTCPRCGQPMQRLDEPQDDAFLDAGQRTEETLRSVDYDVWSCNCGEHLLLPYVKMFSGYGECGACGVKAVKTIRRIVDQPTVLSTGLAVLTHHCEHCRHTTTSEEVLPRLTPPSPRSHAGAGSGTFSSGGGGSSSGGGSFGGSGTNDGGGGGASY